MAKDKAKDDDPPPLFRAILRVHTWKATGYHDDDGRPIYLLSATENDMRSDPIHRANSHLGPLATLQFMTSEPSLVEAFEDQRAVAIVAYLPDQPPEDGQLDDTPKEGQTAVAPDPTEGPKTSGVKPRKAKDADPEGMHTPLQGRPEAPVMGGKDTPPPDVPQPFGHLGDEDDLADEGKAPEQGQSGLLGADGNPLSIQDREAAGPPDVTAGEHSTAATEPPEDPDPTPPIHSHPGARPAPTRVTTKKPGTPPSK